MAIKKKTPKQKKTKTASKARLKSDALDLGDCNNKDSTLNDHSEAVGGLLEDCSGRVDNLLEAVQAAGLTVQRPLEVNNSCKFGGTCLVICPKRNIRFFGNNRLGC